MDLTELGGVSAPAYDALVFLRSSTVRLFTFVAIAFSCRGGSVDFSVPKYPPPSTPWARVHEFNKVSVQELGDREGGDFYPSSSRDEVDLSGVLPAGDVAPPVAAISKQPEWPAARTFDHGRTVVDIVVDEQGQVVAMRWRAGDLRLVGSVLDALSKWRFEPATRNGIPVSAFSRIEFDY